MVRQSSGTAKDRSLFCTPGLFSPISSCFALDPAVLAPSHMCGAALTLVPSEALRTQLFGDARDAASGALGLSPWPYPDTPRPRAAGALPDQVAVAGHCSVPWALP